MSEAPESQAPPERVAPDDSPPERSPGWVRRLVRGVSVLVGVLSLVAAATLVTLTRTPFGRNAAASMIAGAIGGAVDGEVRIGAILGGNLLTRVTVERFEITDPDGVIFLAADTIRLEYDPLGFFTNDFHFRQGQAARVELSLLQGADGRWNFERIFAGDESERAAAETEAPDEAGGLLLLFNDLRVDFGLFEVRRPWSGEAGDEAGLWRLERAEDGSTEQVIRIAPLRVGFPLLRLADPDRPMEFQIEGLTGLADVVSRPLEVVEFEGSVTIADTIAVAIQNLRLPATQLVGAGWVAPGDPLSYHFELAANPVGFSDLQWLPIPLPADGGGPAGLTIRSRGEVLLVEARDGDVRIEDSRITGSFALAAGEPARFESVDVRFAPLRLRTLDRQELIDGYIEGTLRGAGPLSDLRIRTNLTLRDLDGAAEPSRVSAEGGVSLVDPFPVRELGLAFESFEPKWTAVLGFDTGVIGRIDGTATLDGVPGGLLAFDADVFHRRGESLSHLDGRGSFDLEAASVIDVSLDADPLSLGLLERDFPELELVGEVRGPIRARGSLDDLEVTADLQTPRGQLGFDGRFDLESEPQTYDAQVRATGLALDRWVEGAPKTDLAVRGRVVGEGTDPATLRATFDLEILPSVFQEVSIDTSRVRFSFAEGLASVDTFAIDTDVGHIEGRGSFGLSDRTGVLILVASSPVLESWNRWILGEIPGGAQAQEGEDLFAGFGPEAEAEREAAAAPVEGLAGSLFARGVLFGNLDRYQVGGQLEARDVRYGTTRADSVVARLNFLDPTQLDSLVLLTTAWGLHALGEDVDSLTARLARYDRGTADLELYSARDTSVELRVATGLEWGTGRFAADVESFRLEFEGDALVLQAPTHLAYGDAGLVARGLELSGPAGTIRADGEIPAEGEGRLQLSVDGVELEQLADLFPEPPPMVGTLSVRLDMGGTLDAPTAAGTIRVDGPAFETARYTALETDLRYADRELQGDLEIYDGPRIPFRIEGRIGVNLALRAVEEDRLADDAFDLVWIADRLPLDLLELQFETLEDVVGTASGRVRVRGRPGDLRYDGELALADAETSIPNLGIRLTNVAAQAAFRGSEARLDSLVATSGENGLARVEGRIGVSEFGDPTFDLDFSMDRFRAMDRYAMSFLLSGDGRLGGSYERPEFSGRFQIRDGDIRQDEFLRGREVIDLTDPDIYSLIDTTVVAERRLIERFRNPFMQNLRMDVELDLGPNLWLRADVMDVEMAAQGLEVSMDRAEESLVMIGSVELTRGTYRFDRIPGFNQQLRITDGTIDFLGVPGLNPNVDITAEYRTRTPSGPVTVAANITGTFRENEVILESNPPMSDSDQFCFIALGSPCYGASDTRFVDQVVQASILGGLSSGLSSAFVGSTGLSYLNLRTTGSQYGQYQDLPGQQGLFARTELELGRYAGENLFFMVGLPLGGGVPRASVEWRFSENWTLEARAENRFDQQQYGLYQGTNNILNDQTYGLFLFREWSF